MSTGFSPDVARLIQEQFALGHYASEDELVAEAVRLLGQRDRLQGMVDAGTEQLAAGAFTDYDSETLRERFDQIKAGQRFEPPPGPAHLATHRIRWRKVSRYS